MQFFFLKPSLIKHYLLSNCQKSSYMYFRLRQILFAFNGFLSKNSSSVRNNWPSGGVLLDPHFVNLGRRDYIVSLLWVTNSERTCWAVFAAKNFGGLLLPLETWLFKIQISTMFWGFDNTFQYQYAKWIQRMLTICSGMRAKTCI